MALLPFPRNPQPLKPINLLLDSSRGVYIPKNFIEEFNLDDFRYKLSDADRETLSDPSNEGYWDVWQDILDNAYYVDSNGNEYRLYQDGDVWLVCDALLTEDEYAEFYGDYD